VILVDANILVYAHVEGMEPHARARQWLDGRLNGSALVGLPWPSLLAFMRLVTNPRMFESPESTADAWSQVSRWLDCEATWIPQPTPRHAAILKNLLMESNAQANLIPDAHLAALAIEHGLTLCTTDGDFAQFPDLHWENPLRS
jgi:hypothetical protein